LTSVVIPDKVTIINYATFADCPSLASVTIGASVETIGGGVFYKCFGLTNVVIPDKVTTIDNYAFEECTNLVSVTNLNPVPQDIESYVFEGVTISGVTLKVPNDAVATYEAAAVWTDFKDPIEGI
jgi:hypothetical protein